MELWDLYDKDRIKTGKDHIRGEKMPEGYYHIIVHICIFNSKDEMLIQQRQPFKEGWPNMWDVTVGGSATKGDNSQTAAQRELFEEIGLKYDFSDIRPHLTVNFENGFDDYYILEKEVDISKLKLQESEVQAVKWASKDEILAMIDNGEFIPYYPAMIELLYNMRNRYSARTPSNRW